MKVYKVIEDYFYTTYMNDRIYLKIGDLLFIEKAFVRQYVYSENFKEVNLLTKVIKSNETIIVNTVKPFLSDYGLGSTGRCFNNFDELSSGFKILEDITIQYLRDEKIKKICC